MNNEKREAAREKAVRQYYEEPASIAGDKYPFCVGYDTGYADGLAAASQWKVIETDGLPEEGTFLFLIRRKQPNDIVPKIMNVKEIWPGTQPAAYMPIPPFTKGETEE